jgi:hypothetical protein
MTAKMYVLLTLFVVLIINMTNCVGITKPNMPQGLDNLRNDKARIVVTRENQLAGAGSHFELIDVGTNIDANGMMAVTLLNHEQFLQNPRVIQRINKEFLRNNYIFFSNIWPLEELVKPEYDYFVATAFFWANPNKLNNRFCGSANGICGNELKKELIEKEGFLRGDVGLYKSKEVYALRLAGHTVSPAKISGMLVGDRVAFNQEPILSEQPPKLIKIDLALLERVMRYDIGITEIAKDLTFGPYPVQAIEGIGAEAPLVFHTTFKYIPSQKVNAPSLSLPNHPVSVYREIQLIDHRVISHNVQLIERLAAGETVIWDRKPGKLRLGAIWQDGVGFMREDIEVEAGKTYYIHYTTKMAFKPRWELIQVN